MPTTLQFRRGNAAQNNSFTGAAGEITFDVTNKTLRVHDASTQGGTRLATFAEVLALQAANALDSDIVKLIAENDLKLLDSDRALSLIDSDYIQARVTAGTDSSATIALIDAHALDSGRATALIDSAYINARSDANVDSAKVSSIITADVNATFINNLTIDADTLAGQNGAFYRAYGNLTGKPTIPAFGTDFVDSAAAITLADARIANNLIDEDNFASNSNSRAPSQQSVKAFVDAYVGELIDEDNMASNSSSRPPSQQSVKAYVDTEVSGLVASAPGALDTLNELAAAIGDDANFSTTITNSIATKATLAQAQAVDPKLGTDFVDSAETLKLIDANALDSARATSLINASYVQARQTNYGNSNVQTLVDSAYVQARVTAGTDSAATLALIDANALDSARGRALIQGSDLDMGTNKILYANVYANINDLPNASTYHGMFAHVHATGYAYFSHAGAWYQLIDTTSVPKLGSDFIDSAEALKLIDANALDSARAISLIAVPKFGTDFIDSATANTLADARIANNIIDEDNFSTNSATRAPSQQSVKAYVDANGGSSLTVQEEGSSLSTAATTLNFVGSNVTATGSGATKTITITGSGGIALSDLSGNKGLTYNSGTGVFDVDSANIKSFTVQHLGTDFVDSAEALKLIDANALDSGRATSLIDSDYIQLRQSSGGGNSVSNGSNDRILTSTGGNGINAEANFQFDGTNLFIPAEIRHIGDPDTKIGFTTDTITYSAGGVSTQVINASGTTITGNIAVTGTVDGRDVATDGTKLDGIASNATATVLGTDFVDSAETLTLINANALDSARALLVAETEFSVTTANGGAYKFTGDGFPSQSGDNPTLYFARGKRYVIHNASYGAHPLYIKTTPGTGTGNQYASGTAGQGTAKVTFDVPMDAPTLLHYQCSAHSAMRGSIVILSDASAVDSAQVTGIVDSDYVNIRSLKGLSVTTASASGGGTLAYNNVTGVFTFAPSTNSGGGGGGSGLDSALTTQLIDSAYVQIRQSAGGSSLTVQDEGSALSTAATTLNFVGSGVVASGTGATKTITIAGGSGGSGSAAELTKHTYFATSGQTQFSGADEGGTSLSFDAGTINVYHNGIQIRAVDDYIESAGTNRITFTQAVDSDDIIVIDKFATPNAGAAGLSSFEYFATSGQTQFSGTDEDGESLSFGANQIQVHQNGVLLKHTNDYIESAGTNRITLASAADSDDIVTVSVFSGSGSSGGGGTSWQSLKTANYTATAGQGVLTNTTGGAFTVSLPSSPSAGDEVKIVDAYGVAGTNNVTIARNSSKILGADSDFILDINRAAVSLVYVDATQGWIVTEK